MKRSYSFYINIHYICNLFIAIAGSSRSLEGTAAFVVSILLFVLVLQLVGVLPMTQAKWFATIFAALNTALVEAFTDQVDNLVLPLVFYILVGLA